MVEVGQAQCLGHHIQLEFAQVGQKLLRKGQGICRSKVIFIAQAGAFTTDKAGIKLGIVGNQHTVSHKFQEFRQRLLDFRCANQQIVGNSCQIDDLLGKLAFRVNKGLETFQLFAVLH